MNDDIVPYFHTRINFHARINDAAAADFNAFPYIYLFIDFRKIAHFRLLAYECAVTDIDFLPDLG